MSNALSRFDKFRACLKAEPSPMPHTPTGQGGPIDSIWLLGAIVPGGIIAGAGLVHYGPRIPLWGWVVIATAVYAIQRAL